MTDVLLIVPPETRGGTITGKNLASYKEIPYGVLSIVSYVKAHASRDVQFSILDLNVLEDESPLDVIERELLSRRPDIVGISALFNSLFEPVLEISKCVKSVAPSSLLIVGGNISTNCYEELFQSYGEIDGACYSEGEIPLLDLIECSDRRRCLEEHPSWITGRKISEGRRPSPAFVQDLDDIPPLDYSLLKLERYGTRCRNNNPIEYEEEGALRLPFITTRGCPFDCVFCAAASLSGKKVRFMSAERVVSDIRRARDLYGMTKVVINDDQALIRKKRIHAILDGLAELELILEFPSGLNAKFVDEAMAKKLAAAGLGVANLAVESGSPFVLEEIIRKPLKLDDVRRAARCLRAEGLFVHGFFIFGFPDEREVDRQETIDLILEIGFDWSNIYVAAPLRGSRLYELYKERGYISRANDSLDTNIYESVVSEDGEGPESVTKYVYRQNLNLNFVKNYRYSIGDFKIARRYFENVSGNHGDHAFAHYFLAQSCCHIEGEERRAESAMSRYFEIIEQSSAWRDWAEEFGLPLGRPEGER